MAAEVKRQINSLLVRWDNKGNYQGASVTNLIEVFEDGEFITAEESKPIDVSIDDLANQAEVAKIIGKVQVDQAKEITKKENERQSLIALRDQLAKNLEDKEAEKRIIEIDRDTIKAERDQLKAEKLARGK